MLKVGGYINILIAIGHLAGLFWADKMFEVTGIGKEMNELAQTHSSLPFILTIFVAIFFFIFGLYGLSAHGRIMELPFSKAVIFLIAGIYLLRGFGELIVNNMQGTASISETIYSLTAVLIGFLFLIGGLTKWSLIKKKKQQAANKETQEIQSP